MRCRVIPDDARWNSRCRVVRTFAFAHDVSSIVRSATPVVREAELMPDGGCVARARMESRESQLAKTHLGTCDVRSEVSRRQIKRLGSRSAAFPLSHNRTTNHDHRRHGTTYSIHPVGSAPTDEWWWGVKVETKRELRTA